MKIVLHQWEDGDGYARESMRVDGQNQLYVGPLCECPEDAIVGRDLIDCSTVLSYMRMAHRAGREQQPLEVVLVAEED